jgi:hypothetical protein
MNYNSSLCLALLLVALYPPSASGQDWPDLYRIKDLTFRSHVEYHGVKVPTNTEIVLADLKGPGKVTYWYITDDKNGHWYPGLVLKVFWDDETEPGILTPLADFFGAFGGRTFDYQSAPMQINHLCYMCYLPMPFSRRARFVLANDGDVDYAQSMAYGIDYEEGQEFAAEPSRLHCMWRRSNPTQEALHTILEARGRGQYIGNFLQVHSNYTGWWGEGDTLFHLDGQTITHSPGTEDEYGACWGFGGLFSYPTCGYIQKEGGDHRMYRWYLANPVRFGSSLKVEIQNQRWDKGQVPSSDDYTSVAFWYQAEPHRPFSLQSFTERTAPSHAAEYK